MDTGHRATFPIIKSKRQDVVTVEQVQAALDSFDADDLTIKP